MGSSNSNKYHFPSCKWAQKINPENLVKFKSANEAQEVGYTRVKCVDPRPKIEVF